MAILSGAITDLILQYIEMHVSQDRANSFIGMQVQTTFYSPPVIGGHDMIQCMAAKC